MKYAAIQAPNAIIDVPLSAGDHIKWEFLMDRQFGGFTLQKQVILQETQIFFATSGLIYHTTSTPIWIALSLSISS